jgi:DNA-binding NarL/FixJ family response regulator
MFDSSLARQSARILLIDDHPLIRKGLAAVIGAAEELTVCGEASTAAEGLQLLVELNPDLIIVDLTLEDSHGLELMKQARQLRPNLRMLAVSMHDEAVFAERVLQAGAMGYVHKARATDEIVSAIRIVLAGRIYLSPEAADRLLRQVTTGGEVKPQNSVSTLSDRELAVFEMLGKGLTTRQIAEKLFLSHKTIETHRERIKKKLNLNNSAVLVKSAVEWVMQPTADMVHTASQSVIDD